MPNSLFDNSETGLSVSVDRDEEGLSLHFFTKKKMKKKKKNLKEKHPYAHIRVGYFNLRGHLI